MLLREVFSFVVGSYVPCKCTHKLLSVQKIKIQRTFQVALVIETVTSVSITGKFETEAQILAMRLASEAACDLANTKFFFQLLANTYIINLRNSHVTIIQKAPESFHRFRRFFINLLCCKISHILFNDFPTW